MKIATLSAKAREGAGKGAARAVRREGMIPGVIYGNKKPPVLIAVSKKDLDMEVRKKGFWTRQYEIEVEGNKYRGICQDIQNDPVTDIILHIDFLRVSRDSKIYIEVPVIFINEDICPGIKMGGALNVVTRDIEVVCRPDDIPESFTIDLAGFNINDSVHNTDLEMPKGVSFAGDGAFTIASITPPASTKEDVAPVAESSEASVDSEKKK